MNTYLWKKKKSLDPKITKPMEKLSWELSDKPAFLNKILFLNKIAAANIKDHISPGMVVHTCNHSTFGGWGGWIIWGLKFETTLTNMVKHRLHQKYKKGSWAWWHAPVFPCTWEAEAGELLEPGRRRLQWAKITPLHSSLVPGDGLRLCQKKKSKE